MRRAKLRKVHALLERRGFLAMLAARLMPGVSATGLHYVAGVAPVGVPAFAATMVLGALVWDGPICRARPGDRLGSLATILIAGASIAVGAVTARGPGATPPNPRCRHLSFASASRKSKAAAALLRDRCLPSVSR
jgi:hypothetical protein